MMFFNEEQNYNRTINRMNKSIKESVIILTLRSYFNRQNIMKNDQQQRW